MKNKMSENGIEYVLVGDYYIPDLKLPNEERSIGIRTDAPCLSQGASSHAV